MSSRTSATLLVGFDPRTALAIARSLWRAKIRVVVATIAEWEMPLRSRAVEAYVRLPGPEQLPEKFRDGLEAVLERYEIDTIIPVTDRALILLSQHLGYLSTRVTLACPDREQVSIVLDKAATGALAVELGVPTPLRFDPQILGKRIADLPFPLFVKARDKRIHVESDASTRPGAHFIQNAASLQKLLEKCANTDLLVEQYVVGEDVGLAVLVDAGEALATFQYRAELLYPADGGISVVARTELVDESLLNAAMKLLRQLKWRGIAQLDFRHDRQTGKFAFLEINGRFWGSSAVAVLAGLDLPLLTWQLAKGQMPVVPKSYRLGLRARWFEGDLRRLLLLLSEEPKLSLRERVIEVLRFCFRFRFGSSGMFWSWQDPRPAIQACLEFTRCWLLQKLRNASESKSSPTEAVPPRETSSLLNPPLSIERRDVGK